MICPLCTHETNTIAIMDDVKMCIPCRDKLKAEQTATKQSFICVDAGDHPELRDGKVYTGTLTPGGFINLNGSGQSYFPQRFRPAPPQPRIERDPPLIVCAAVALMLTLLAIVTAKIIGA